MIADFWSEPPEIPKVLSIVAVLLGEGEAEIFSEEGILVRQD